MTILNKEQMIAQNKKKIEAMIPVTAPFQRSISSVADRVLFIGVGRCGGAIVNEMQRRGYETYYINTAIGDFQNLERVTKPMTYQISGGDGASRDREYAKALVKNYADEITLKIRSSYANYQHIVFVFSTGGGTGSGVAPALAQYMGVKYKMNTSLVGVINSKGEGREATQNSYDAVEEMFYNCKSVKSKFLLDNSNVDSKLDVNTQFADIIDSLLLSTRCQPNYKEDYVQAIDPRELLAVLSTEGFVHVSKIKTPYKSEGDSTHPYHIDDKLKIFTEYNKDAVGREMVVSVSYKHSDDLSPAHLKKKYGINSGFKAGFNRTEDSYCFIFGLPEATEVLARLDEWLGEYEESESEKNIVVGHYTSKNRNKNKQNQNNEEPIDDGFNPFANNEEEAEIDNLLFSDFNFM